MKIAFVRQKYNPFGGGERFLQRVATSLANSGTSVHILTRQWQNPNLTDNNIHVKLINPNYIGRTWRDYSFAKAINLHINKNNYDVVQSNDRINGCQIFRAGDGIHREWLKQKNKINNYANFLPSIFHRYQLDNEAKMLLNPSLKAVICNSQMVVNEIKQYFPKCPAELLVFHNGVNLENFKPATNSTERKNLAKTINHNNPNWSPDMFTLIFVGSGFVRKGLTQTINALALTTKVQLIVVGADKELVKYKNFTKKLQINNRVYFAGGQKDVISFYHSADAFIFPSIYDPLGGVVMEAMACALPSITSTKCGAKEFISEGENGFVISAFDISAMAEKIKLLQSYHTHQKISRMGDSARQAIKRCSMLKMSENLLQFYKSFIIKKSI